MKRRQHLGLIACHCSLPTLTVLLPVAAAILLAVTATGCSRTEHQPDLSSAPSSKASEAPVAGSTPKVEGARVVAMSDVAALYFDLEAPAGERLLSVESSAGGSLDLHETVLDGDVVRMESRPDGLEIPAEGRLELRPGGAHVMWMGWVAESDSVQIVLNFKDAGRLELVAAVERSTTTGDSHHGDSHHGDSHHGEADTQAGADSHHHAPQHEDSSPAEVVGR